MIDLTGVSHHRLLELLSYDPSTGVFTRKVSLSNRTPVGSIAGTVTKGYSYLYVDGTRYAAHRLAWFYVHGVWPTNLLDHRNLYGTVNNIDNLRPATKSTNGANRGLNKNNSSGFKGVVEFRKNRFLAGIKVNKVYKRLGYFLDPKEAAVAYDLAAVEHFGEFALTNKSLGLL